MSYIKNLAYQKEVTFLISKFLLQSEHQFKHHASYPIYKWSKCILNQVRQYKKHKQLINSLDSTLYFKTGLYTHTHIHTYIVCAPCRRHINVMVQMAPHYEPSIFKLAKIFTIDNVFIYISLLWRGRIILENGCIKFIKTI